MRRVYIGERDFALFHQDINQTDYRFFLRHTEAFKTMWAEQVSGEGECEFAYALLLSDEAVLGSFCSIV